MKYLSSLPGFVPPPHVKRLIRAEVWSTPCCKTYLHLWRPLQAVKHSTQHLEDRRGQQNVQHIREHRKAKLCVAKSFFLKRRMFVVFWNLLFMVTVHQTEVHMTGTASDRQTELSEPYREIIYHLKSGPASRTHMHTKGGYYGNGAWRASESVWTDLDLLITYIQDPNTHRQYNTVYATREELTQHTRAHTHTKTPHLEHSETLLQLKFVSLTWRGRHELATDLLQRIHCIYQQYTDCLQVDRDPY